MSGNKSGADNKNPARKLEIGNNRSLRRRRARRAQADSSLRKNKHPQRPASKPASRTPLARRPADKHKRRAAKRADRRLARRATAPKTLTPAFTPENFSRSGALTCVVLTRNAARFLPGWLAWHFALGVERVVIADSGSTDGSQALAACLARDWPVRLIAPVGLDALTPEERRAALTRAAVQVAAESSSETLSASSQASAEAEYADTPEISETPATKWIMALDADEYLAPSADLPALLARAAETGGLTLHWKQFGRSGHATLPKGHVTAAHKQRGDQTLPEHAFLRVLAPLETHVDLRPRFASEMPAETLWQAGAVLHYPAPVLAHALLQSPKTQTPNNRQDNQDNTLALAMIAHLDCNDVPDDVAQRFLAPMREMQNQLQTTLLHAGLERLRALAVRDEALAREEENRAAQAFLLPPQPPQPDFAYHRVRPDLKTRRLLTPEASPPFSPVRCYRLCDENGAFLTGNDGTPLLALADERTPTLLALTQIALTQLPFEDFTLGDVPVVENWAVCRVSPAGADAFRLPFESGLEDQIFQTVPYRPSRAEAALLPELVSLPVFSADRDDLPGISPELTPELTIETLLRWLSAHPWADALDIRRALLLLTPRQVQTLQRLVPELGAFLPEPEAETEEPVTLKAALNRS